jgi:hypothetical protein
MISNEYKQKMCNKIANLKKKSEMIKILEIIAADNSHLITENNNGLFILFNKLTQPTYAKLDEYLKSIPAHRPKMITKPVFVPKVSTSSSEKIFTKTEQRLLLLNNTSK